MKRMILAGVFASLLAACAVFGGSSRAEVATAAASIESCQEAGRDAGTYAAYDACMKDAGLR